MTVCVSSLQLSVHVKGGSFQKSTMMDPQRRDGPSEERSDIDLVIFLQNLTIDQHIAQLPAQLKLIESILLSANPPFK